MVIPNKRRATTSGGILATTRRAGTIFPPAALSVAYVEQLHSAPSALLEEKMISSSVNKIGVNRP